MKFFRFSTASLVMMAMSVFAGIAAASPALAFTLANRVFVSARSGNDANLSCDNINTPCQTFAGAVTRLFLNGEVIVLDSGGYGPVIITQGVTIEAPAGVTAFIHPPSGDAITITAGSSDKVTLRGLTLNVGTGNGITVNSVGTLNVENCFITGFADGIRMLSAGRLDATGTDITACNYGIALEGSIAGTEAAIDHCHLDGNTWGFYAGTTSPGSSSTTATYTTANNNTNFGWTFGGVTTGRDVLNLEFCTGAENGSHGLAGNSSNALSVVRYSNCVFANNGGYGLFQYNSETFQSRGSNTVTGNALGATSGTIGSFSPM